MPKAFMICIQWGRGPLLVHVWQRMAGSCGPGFAVVATSLPVTLAELGSWRRSSVENHGGRRRRASMKWCSREWMSICAIGVGGVQMQHTVVAWNWPDAWCQVCGRTVSFGVKVSEHPAVKDMLQEELPGGAPGLQRLEAREPPGVAPFLAGYRGHKVCVVSRRTLCAACYQVAPSKCVEAFRNMPCGGNQPGAAAPGFLVHALRRNGAVPVDAGTRERLDTLAVLVGGGRARSVELPLAARVARRPEPATTRSGTVGVALLAAGRLVEAARR